MCLRCQPQRPWGSVWRHARDISERECMTLVISGSGPTNVDGAYRVAYEQQCSLVHAQVAWGSIGGRNNRENKFGWSRTGARHPVPQFQCCFLSRRLWSSRSTIKETWFCFHVDVKIADERGANIEILGAGGWQGPPNLEIHNFGFPIISPGYGPQMAGVLQTLVETYAFCVAFHAWNVHANIVMNNSRIHNGYAAWARGCHVTDERNTCQRWQERAKACGEPM